MIYLITFLISSMFLYISDKGRGTGKKIFAAIGLLFPIMLAAMRSEDVGIDVQTYVKPLYKCIVRSSDLSDLFTLVVANNSTHDLEVLFVLVSYFACKYLGGLHGMFFIYEFIIMLCVYCSISVMNNGMIKRNHMKNISTWQVMSAFYLMFYNMSLTMIRQSIACALVMLAFSFLLSGKYKTCFGVTLIATLFHNTAFFGFFIFGLYFVIKNKMRIVKWLYCIAMFVFAIYGTKIYVLVLSLLSRFGIVSGRYLSLAYMDFTGSDINLAFVYAIIGFTAFAFLLRRDNKKNYDCLYIFITMASMFAFIPISVISANAGRILYYYFYIGLFTGPLLRNANKHKYNLVDDVRFKAGNKQLLAFTIIMFGLIYWLGTTGLNDYTGTAKYMTDLF